MEPLSNIHNILLACYASASTLSYFYMDRFNLWLLGILIKKTDNPDEILKALQDRDPSFLTLKSKLDTSEEPVEIIHAEVNENSQEVDEKQEEKIVKIYNYTIFAELNDQKVLIKYNRRINEKLRKLLAFDYNTVNEEIGYIKERGLISSIPIAAAISAYARMSINIYKNMPNNKVIYSDTDSLILEKPLDLEVVGTDLGKWKLEAIIKEIILIKSKLYYYETIDNKIVKKGAGVDAESLSKNDYIKLAKGENVSTNIDKTFVDWKNLQIEIYNKEIELQGVKIKSLIKYDKNKFAIVPYGFFGSEPNKGFSNKAAENKTPKIIYLPAPCFRKDYQPSVAPYKDIKILTFNEFLKNRSADEKFKLSKEFQKEWELKKEELSKKRNISNQNALLSFEDPSEFLDQYKGYFKGGDQLREFKEVLEWYESFLIKYSKKRDGK